MPREILIQIINGNLLVELFIILIVFFAVNWVIFRLIFQVLGVKKKFKELLPGVLLIIIYNTCGKQILPVGLAYGLTLVGLLVIMIKVIARDAVTWMQAFWGSFLSYFIVGLGVWLFEDPLFSFNPAIARFITTTPIGVAVGTILCEGIFPLVALFLLKTIDISIIPPAKRKINLVDAANLYLFAGMFALLYNNSAQLLKNIGTRSRLELIKDNLFQLFLVGSFVVVYYFVYTNTKKQRENERRHHEAELRKHEERQRMNQEKMQKLEDQHKRLGEMYEQLQNTKERPQKVLDTLSSAMGALKDYYDSLTIQNESEIVLENDVLTKITFNETESKIIELIIQGKTDKEIAKIVYLSAGRVSNIIAELLSRTGMNNRTMLAVRYALLKYPKK